MVDNDFFKCPVAGISKDLSISRVIGLAVGRRLFMSKRLSPPMTICNGRIYANGDFVHSSDIEVPKFAKLLVDIALEYGVVIGIYQESGHSPMWSSDRPDEWLGYAEVNGVEKSPVKIIDAFPYFEALHKKRVRQWQLDHGIARRSPREWFKDVYWDLRWKWKHATRKKQLNGE